MLEIHTPKKQICSQADLQMRHLVRESGLPLKVLADAIGHKTQNILEWWSFRQNAIQEKDFLALGKFLGISPESLIDNTVDLSLVRQRILEGPRALPEKFSENAASHVRTSAHIIEYLSLLHGRHFTDSLLLDLNIHPLFFDDLNNKINLQFFIDLFERLSKRGVSDGDIASLASYIFLKIRGSDFGKILQGFSNHTDFYETLAANSANSMEANFDYVIEGNRDSLKVIARPTEANLFIEKRDPKELKRLFLYRHNIFNWFPTLGGLSPLSMKVTKCVSQGDKETVYEAFFPRLKTTDGAHAHLRSL